MGKVVLAFTMSLDGYVAGREISAAEPMGRGGERLHDWMFRDHPDRAADEAVAKESVARTGATIVGRRTFDLGLPHWDNETPYPGPSFVFTHRGREPLPTKKASFTFVDDGIESAVRQAKAAAGDKDVTVMGAETAQHVLKAGLADELALTVAPVLLGGGTRLFDNIGDGQIELNRIRAVETAVATHLWFSVHRP
jgi:dihydrofolate reductase